MTKVEGCCRSLPAEVARAVRDELWSRVLAKKILPRLSSFKSQPLWSHFVAEAAAFERRLAVARGLGAGNGIGNDDDESAAAVDAAWPDADGGILSRLCSSSPPVCEWRDSWWECDKEAGVRAVEDAAGTGKGGGEWHAAAGAAVAAAQARAADEAALGGIDDFGNSDNASAAVAAAVVLPSSLEFAPPPVAEAAARALVEAASRVAWLPSWSPASAAEGGEKRKKKKRSIFVRTPSLARPRYVDAAARPVLQAFRLRASRAAEAAARFGDPLADPTRAAVVGGVASGARWLEHELREAGWPLLLLDEGCCSSSSTSGLSPSASGDGTKTESENGKRPHHHHHSPRPSVLAAEADALASLSRKWTTRLAKAAADAFERAATAAVKQAVRGDSYLLSSPLSSSPQEDDENASYFIASGPTPALVPALSALSDALGAASRALDSVAFRSVWRAAACAATRLLFNEVATEARFDGAGGRQLAADAAALASVFAPFSAPRAPGAHVRELSEAAALLSLPSVEAAALKAAVRGNGGKGNGGESEAFAAAVAALRSVGVSRLSPDQAAAVLARRAF